MAHPLERDVVEWDVYTGHLEAPQVANVAARVSGLIVEMPFEEGAIVKRGDVLAVIDDRPFKADLDLKQADQQKAESALALANITFDRTATLRKTNAVSQQDFDNAKAACEQAAAVVAGAKAAVESARLNLEWCRVLSPIDGRVSYKKVTVGNLVNGGAGQAALLTTVESVSPVFCYVDVDENSVLKYQKLAEERKLLSARDGKVPCYVELGNEAGFPHQGVDRLRGQPRRSGDGHDARPRRSAKPIGPAHPGPLRPHASAGQRALSRAAGARRGDRQRSEPTYRPGRGQGS